MFTGIVQDVGVVEQISNIANGKRMKIKANKIIDKIKNGDSVAVNGACLTVVEFSNAHFEVDVSFETLNKTNLGSINTGAHVNLERALRLSDGLDGHLVLGHVDKTASISDIKRLGDFFVLKIAIDNYIFSNCVEKGSICIDGISLTIANLSKTSLEIAVIPFTFENTNLKYKKIGESVNIELDIIGKYVKKFLGNSSKEGITEEFLSLHGFV